MVKKKLIQYGNDIIRLPNYLVNHHYTLESFVDKMYPNLNDSCNIQNMHYITERGILTPLNQDVQEINNIALSKMEGDEVILKSIDKLKDDNNCFLFPIEFLNSLELSGLPSHQLKLKKNCIIMSLRNLDPSHGVCNGTRLIVNNFTTRVIEATILNAPFSNSRVFIPRIPCNPETRKIPIEFIRLQFPVTLAFALTINKAQGQTLSKVGIYLSQPVFQHGQLNVALTRATNPYHLHIFVANHGQYVNDDCFYTKNIVYHEIL